MPSDLAAKLRAFDPDLPLERAHTIPSAWYFDPEIYEAERRGVFASTWQVAGRLDQLVSAGNFVTFNIAGEPILVLRGGDGILRAFHNVCRHRAAQVINEPEGAVTRLRCRYHGWTYDLAGKLRGTPEFEGVADFCRDEQGLVELAVASWGPFAWIRSRDGSCTLADHLRPLPARSAGLGLETMRFVERRAYRLECNWKVFVDNYLDGGYHVNTVHPGLAGVLDYSQYRTEIFESTSVQTSPLRSDSAVEAAGKVRTGANAYYWWIFPNFMMNIYQGVMDTNLVLPLGPDRCEVIFDFYFDPARAGDAQFMTESMEVAHQIQLEDVGICEEVQKGLKSRSYDSGRFSVKREAAGYHFHRLLARSLKSSA